jgi:hypothetical protein
MLYRFLLPLAFMLHAAACAGIAPRATPAPATCMDVCNNMRTLACPAAQPTAAGASCETVCTNFQQGPAPWDLLCRSIAPSCAAMDQCERR